MSLEGRTLESPLFFFLPSLPPSLLAEYLSLSDEEERVGKRIEAEGCRSLIKEKGKKKPLWP